MIEAMLNKRSLSADVEGVLKYFSATKYRKGNSSLLASEHQKATGSNFFECEVVKYFSISAMT
jgi:hypothetical protein